MSDNICLSLLIKPVRAKQSMKTQRNSIFVLIFVHYAYISLKQPINKCIIIMFGISWENTEIQTGTIKKE